MNNYTATIIFIALGIISFSLYTTRCHGQNCNQVSNVADVASVGLADNQIYPNMNPENIKKQLSQNEIVLIDVREESEWQAGHIGGAIHIALGDLNEETTKNLPKNLPIYTYCRSGVRAGNAAQILKSLGFAKAENIGGIIHWQERGGELVK